MEYPWLPVAVIDVHLRVVPCAADADEVSRVEAVVRHHDEVGEEAGRRLDDPDLEVAEEEEPERTLRC